MLRSVENPSLCMLAALSAAAKQTQAITGRCLSRMVHGQARLSVDNCLKASRVEGRGAGVVAEEVEGVHAARRARVPQRGPIQQQLARGAEAQALWVACAPAWKSLSNCGAR